MSFRQPLVYARVSPGLQQSVVTFFQEYQVKSLGYNRLVFIRFLPTFEGELGTIIKSSAWGTLECVLVRSIIFLFYISHARDVVGV